MDLDGSASAPMCHVDLSYDAALTMMLADVAPGGVETVALEYCGGRRLAESVPAGIDAPRCDVAAMDGYAVTDGDGMVGRKLQMIGATCAGEPPVATLRPGQTVRVTTGAPVPLGAGRVIPWESIVLDGDWIEIRSVAARRHIRGRASDFALGEILLQPGRLLDARTLVVAAAGDIASLAVWNRPHMHLVSTGDELATPGQARSAAYLVPDSLGAALSHFACSHGAEMGGMLRLSDDRQTIKAGVNAIVGACDVLVMVGGASKGERDYAKSALSDLGMYLIFAGVAIKPGKPLWFGRLGGTYVLGLPGNPTAALTTACLFLAPLLAKLGGAPDGETPRWHHAPLANDVPANGDREAFLCARLIDGRVHVLDRQSAASQFLLADADILMRQAPYAATAAAGEMVAYAAM